MDSPQLIQTATRSPSDDLTEDHVASRVPVLTANSVVIRNDHLFTVAVDDELACLDETSGNYYGLNSTGRLIWNLLATPLSVQALTDEMLKRYPEAREHIPAEVIAYLSSLVATPLLSVCEVEAIQPPAKAVLPTTDDGFSPPYCAPSLCALSIEDNTHKEHAATEVSGTAHAPSAGPS